MPFTAVSAGNLEWITRPHAENEPARHVAELSELAGFASHTRANVWRYEPGACGRRHRHPHQEETFVVLEGSLTMYLGDPPKRVDVRYSYGSRFFSRVEGIALAFVHAYTHPWSSNARGWLAYELTGV